MNDSSRSPKRGHWRSGLLFLLGVGLALFGGCGGSEEKPPPETELPATTGIDEAEPYAEKLPDETAASGGPDSYPDDFPEDLPVPPDARSESWVAAQSAGLLMTFTSSAEPAEVFSYYNEKLAASGWQTEPQQHGGEIWEIQALKGSRTVRILISAGEDGQGSHFAIAESP